MNLCNHFYEYRPASNFLVKDEDAAEFLQSQFSNELRPFDLGGCTYGLWLNAKGKVVGDSIVLCEENATFRVLSDCTKGDLIAAHLQRHIISDEVVIEHYDQGYILELSVEGIKTLDLKLPRAGNFNRFEGGILMRSSDDRLRLVISSNSDRDILVAKLTASGYIGLSENDFYLLRIAAGIPLIPKEIGNTDLPSEGQLENDAISFTKGCYLSFSVGL